MWNMNLRDYLEKFKARAERAVKEHGATLEEFKELVSTYRESSEDILITNLIKKGKYV